MTLVTETTEYKIGAEVLTGDGACGKLNRVVVDPVARTLTHLVVTPSDHWEIARLVPIDLVASAGPEIKLSCTAAEFEALEDAEETHFLAETEGEPLGYRAEEAYAWPYYGLGMGMGAGVASMGVGSGPLPITYDRVPPDEVEVRRGEQVHATDGDIGHLQGLVIDPSDHHVTHVLLQEGHLWGKRQIAIPITAVTGVDPDGVRLSLTKDQVRDLPPVEVGLSG